MLISDYQQKRNINLSDVQFVTAIALDFMGCRKAAEYVLYMFSKERYIGAITETELNFKLENSNTNVISGFIQAIFSEKFVRNKANSLYQNESFYTLHEAFRDELAPITYDILYENIMRLISLHTVDSYILLYMRTSMWFDVFSKKAAPHNHNLSEETIRRVNQSFIDTFVKLYSANGSYHTASRNPNAYLLHAFGWYRRKGEYFNIINAKSALASVGDEDSRSLIDIKADASVASIDYGSSNYGYAEGINFLEVAKKINAASYSLFNHGSETVAYFDIVSWYKQFLASKLKQKYKSNLAQLSVLYDIQYVNNEFELSGEKRKKKDSRCRVCEQFSVILDKGITAEDIYPFFCNIAEFASREAASGKDGLPLYTWGNIRTKKNNNSQKFQEQYEGFIALRELLTFLKSPKNDMDLNIFNFPVEIFRDKRLLKRFSSLHEYVALQKDVMELVRIVDADFSRCKTSDKNNILLNDTVYDCMMDIFRQSSDVGYLLDKLKNVSLSDGALVNKENKIEFFNRTIRDPIYAFGNKLNQDGGVPLKLQNYEHLEKLFKYEDNRYVLINAIRSLNDVQGKLINSKNSEILRLNSALAILNIVDALFEKLGKPIEINGNYQLKDDNLLETIVSMGIPDNGIDFPVNQNKIIKLNCAQFIKRCIELAGSVIKTRNGGLRDSFNIARIMSSILGKILDSYHNITEDINENSKEHIPNLYLVYAKMLSDNPIINLEYPIKNFFKLQKFMNKGYIIETPEITDDAMFQELMRKNRDSAEGLVEAVNNLLLYYESFFIILSEGKSQALSELKTIGDATGISSKRYKMLCSLNRKIITEKNRTQFAGSVMGLIRTANFSERNNYLIKNNKYVIVGDGYHVHLYGYKVSTGIADEISNNGNLMQDIEPDIKELTQVDIDNIKITWGIRC